MADAKLVRPRPPAPQPASIPYGDIVLAAQKLRETVGPLAGRDWALALAAELDP